MTEANRAQTKLVRTITLLALFWLFLSTSVSAQICTSHPCLWYTASDKTTWLSRISKNTLRWQRLKNYADQSLASTDNYVGRAPALAAVGVLLNNPSYCNKATAIAKDYAAHHIDLYTELYDHGYLYRTSMPYMSMAFDWCYNMMAPADRAVLVDWIASRSIEAFYETYPPRGVGAWANSDPSNNFYWGKMMVWLGALVTYHHDARAVTVYNLMVKKWNEEILPFINSWGKGGVFFESTNYDASWNFGWMLHGVYTATGQNLASQAGTFVDDSIMWRVFSTVPSLNRNVCLGDQSRYPEAWMWSLDRLRALNLLGVISNTTTKEYGKDWLDKMSPNISDYSEDIVFEFLFYPEELPAKDISQHDPFFYAPGPGLSVRRANWSPTSTYFEIWSGPNRSSHINMDNNGFLIFKGNANKDGMDYLIGNVPGWTTFGTGRNTYNHNNMMLGNYEQDWQSPYDSSSYGDRWPSEAGWVEQHTHQPQYSYFVGQAAPAYVQDRSHGGFATVKDYQRKFLYIKGANANGDDDCFLDNIHFEALPDYAALPKKYFLQSKKPFNISGNTYSTDNGIAGFIGYTLLPTANYSMSSTPLYYGYDHNIPSSHTFKLQVSSGNAHDELLNLFCVTSVGDLPSNHTPPKLLSIPGDVTAVNFQNRVYIFDRQLPNAESFTLNMADVRGKEILLLDLGITKPYTIVRWPSGTSVTVPSQSDGTLLVPIEASAEGDTLTITAGGTFPAPPPTVTPLPSTGANNKPGTIRLISSKVKKSKSGFSVSLTLSVTGFKSYQSATQIRSRQNLFSSSLIIPRLTISPLKTRQFTVRFVSTKPYPTSGKDMSFSVFLKSKGRGASTTKTIRIPSK